MSDVRIRCTLCGAAIRWLESAISGRSLPIDGTPAERGDVVLDRGRARVLSSFDQFAIHPGTRRFTLHWNTCPVLKDPRKLQQEPARV